MIAAGIGAAVAGRGCANRASGVDLVAVFEQGWAVSCASAPGGPRTNGKAERLIQTLLNEWAYVRIYGSSSERTAALPLFRDRYNYRRPHGSLGKRTPAARLNNLARNYI